MRLLVEKPSIFLILLTKFFFSYLPLSALTKGCISKVFDHVTKIKLSYLNICEKVSFIERRFVFIALIVILVLCTKVEEL